MQSTVMLMVSVANYKGERHEPNTIPATEIKQVKKSPNPWFLYCDKIWPLEFKTANQNKVLKGNYVEKIPNGSFNHFLGK